MRLRHRLQGFSCTCTAIMLFGLSVLGPCPHCPTIVSRKAVSTGAREVGLRRVADTVPPCGQQDRVLFVFPARRGFKLNRPLLAHDSGSSQNSCFASCGVSSACLALSCFADLNGALSSRIGGQRATSHGDRQSHSQFTVSYSIPQFGSTWPRFLLRLTATPSDYSERLARQHRQRCARTAVHGQRNPVHPQTDLLTSVIHPLKGL